MIILETNSLTFGEIHLFIFLPRLRWEDQQLFGICTGANFPKCWYISWALEIVLARQLVTVTVIGLSCCDDAYQCNVSTSVHLALTCSKQFCCTFFSWSAAHLCRGWCSSHEWRPPDRKLWRVAGCATPEEHESWPRWCWSTLVGQWWSTSQQKRTPSRWVGHEQSTPVANMERFQPMRADWSILKVATLKGSLLRLIQLWVGAMDVLY